VNINIANPLSDSRWDELVARHPRASAFHTRGWLEALVRTHGYEPLVLTSARPGEPMQDGIVLCRVSSWITGTRLVSLPFADHCEPLLEHMDDSREFSSWLRTECDRQRWRYVELRPMSWKELSDGILKSSCSYCFHTLDLSPSLVQIFRTLHRDSVQRRILRADKVGITYEIGRSPELQSEFYRLVRMTRRRQRLIPQPRNWFRHLVDCIGKDLQIRLARKDGVGIAAMLTLQHRSRIIYKYGCSDERSHHLGGVPFLFWRLIEESKALGLEEIDLGRSDLDNEGLIRFKDRFGTRKGSLTYFRYSPTTRRDAAPGWGLRAARQIFSVLPEVISPAAGRILYRHIG
jgi:CelD/BcsL family acetyltransferase involved in cellulose biosynthesis